jgi:protein arginine kinase activator
MKCDLCNNNEATIYLIKIQDSTVKRINICEECAKKYSFLGDEDFHNDFTDILYEFFGEGSRPVSKRVKKIWGNLSYRRNQKCPYCGIDLKTIKKTGLVGCSNCYRELGDVLLPLIKNIQGTLENKSKIPVNTTEKIRAEVSIRNLRHKLQNEILVENFEEAARIRDKIKILENNINGRSE